MPRKKYIPNSEFPYHVTNRCVNKDWFYIPMDEVWEIMCNYLFFIHHAFDVKIHAFVLMDNHFHLIISTPLGNLSKAMAYFSRETSKAIAKRAGRINQIYGGRFHRCLIDSYHYFVNAYKYVYRNPVDAGIVSRVEKYKYSTLPGLIGMQKLIVPIANDTLLFGDVCENVESQLEWLNKTPTKQHLKEVQMALNKSVFTLNNVNRRKSFLETNTL